MHLATQLQLALGILIRNLLRASPMCHFVTTTKAALHRPIGTPLMSVTSSTPRKYCEPGCTAPGSNIGAANAIGLVILTGWATDPDPRPLIAPEEETSSILPRGSALTNGQRPQISTCLEGVA